MARWLRFWTVPAPALWLSPVFELASRANDGFSSKLYLCPGSKTKHLLPNCRWNLKSSCPMFVVFFCVEKPCIDMAESCFGYSPPTRGADGRPFEFFSGLGRIVFHKSVDFASPRCRIHPEINVIVIHVLCYC